MRAAVVEQFSTKPVISDVDVDEPGPGEVLMRVVANGVCHSDLHALTGGHAAFPLPFLAGHEPAGVVEAGGPGVRHLKPGHHVVACLAGFCGHCARCLTGQPGRCTGGAELRRLPGSAPRMSRGGKEVHAFAGIGGFAEQLLVHQHNVVRVPNALDLTRACLLGCGVVTGAGAVWNTADVTAGATVAVIGAGGVGLAAIQAARIAYASRIVAVDLDDEKLELARRCGATDVVNAAKDDPVAAVQALFRAGVDFTFDAIGRPAVAQQALAMAGMGGTITLIGLLRPAESLAVSGMDLMMGKTIKQSLMGGGRFTADIPALAAHTLAGRLDLDAMVSAEHGLDDLNTVLDDLEAGRVLGRSVIRF